MHGPLRFSQAPRTLDDMDTISDRVRGLIAQSGASQGDFATRVGLDNSKLSKSLSGARRFSSLDLARIAESCSVSVDWLLTGQEVQLATAARAEAGSRSGKALTEAKRLSNARADVAFLNHPQPWLPLATPPPRGRLVDQGADLASAAQRRLAEHGLNPVDLDLPSAIEAAFGVDVAVGDLGPKFDGLAVSNDKVKLILAGQSRLPWRQRFTIAHELGHMLAGDNQGVHLDEDIVASTRSGEHSEMRANAFAAALLMPEELLRAAVGIRGLSREGFGELACRLRVSPNALAYRLLNFRLIDAGTCDHLKRETAQSVVALAGLDHEFAVEVAAARRGRPPGLLVRDTYAAYRSGQATLRPYANVLGMDVDELGAELESTEAGDLP